MYKGKLNHSLLQNINVPDAPNLLVDAPSSNKNTYYKVIHFSSWTPWLYFIKNDVIHYSLGYFKIHFFFISSFIEASNQKDTLKTRIVCNLPRVSNTRVGRPTRGPGPADRDRNEGLHPGSASMGRRSEHTPHWILTSSRCSLLSPFGDGEAGAWKAEWLAQGQSASQACLSKFLALVPASVPRHTGPRQHAVGHRECPGLQSGGQCHRAPSSRGRPRGPKWGETGGRELGGGQAAALTDLCSPSHQTVTL